MTGQNFVLTRQTDSSAVAAAQTDVGERNSRLRNSRQRAAAAGSGSVVPGNDRHATQLGQNINTAVKYIIAHCYTK